MSHGNEDDSGGSDSEKHRLPASTRPGGEIRRKGAVRKTSEQSAERRGRSSSRTHRAGSASSEDNPKEWTSVKRPEGNGKQPKATEKRREGSPLAHPRDSSAHKPKATIPNSIHAEAHHRSASVDRNRTTNSPSPLRSESPFQSRGHDAYAFQVAGVGNEIPPPSKKRLARKEEIEKSHLTTSSSSVRTSSAGSAGPKEAQESRFTEHLPKASSSTSLPSNLNPNGNSSKKRKIWESFGDPKRQEIRQEKLEQARNQNHQLTKDQAEEIAEAAYQAWLGGGKEEEIKERTR